jgi:hypothetical protein
MMDTVFLFPVSGLPRNWAAVWILR